MAEASWNLKVNVSGEKFFEPGTFDRLSDGVHAVKILQTTREEAKGEGKADNIVFSVEVVDGPDKGKKARMWMTTDLGETGSIQRRHWKNLLTCVAKDPAVLEKGELNIGPKTFADKNAFVFVQNPPDVGTKKDGKTVYANLNFVTMEQAKKLKADAGAKASGKANGATKEFEVSGGAGGGTAEAAAELGDL